MKAHARAATAARRTNDESSASHADAAVLSAPASGVDFVDSGLSAVRVQRASTAGETALPNRTGLPDTLKAGTEALSGMDLSDVRVHVNSATPARLNAYAYALGDDIHIAPGHERYLAHEAWHIVQQREGRVSPTFRLGGVGVNDDEALEREADRMGALASRPPRALDDVPRSADAKTAAHGALTLQAVWEQSNAPGATQQWDALMDGVRWYADDTGAMWYVVEQQGAANYSQWEGPKHKDTFEKWRQLRWSVFPQEYPELTSADAIPQYLYKGVAPQRLANDLTEAALPTGIRPFSATWFAMKKSAGRQPTKLDDITLWFGERDTAEDYCKSHSASILLRVDVQGHAVLKSGKDYFTVVPVAWNRVSYFNRDGGWTALTQGKMPGNTKDFSVDDDDDDEGYQSD